ncbi:SRPBCC domain-containing protein [Aeromicrobium sp.]|uniref:SRPBCC domain-containing protein n=1 Tax=Aeromicrobium sp. TaxID=1871063 RepID=UPI002FC80F07
MTIAPVIRNVVVSASPEAAYQAWAGRIGEWWPLSRHSVYQKDNTVAWIDDQIVETSSNGETSVWGRVLESNPPGNLSFTWHPGRGPEAASTVVVDFVPIAEGRTLVRLTHSGWEIFDEPVDARNEYRNGWPTVVASFRDTVPDHDADGEAWLVLEHRPGCATDGSIYTHPLFAEHLAFVSSLKDKGVLIAAGPMPDQPGVGQTIIRVPAADAPSYVEAAHDDAAVTGDLLVLRVRPWNVMVS